MRIDRRPDNRGERLPFPIRTYAAWAVVGFLGLLIIAILFTSFYTVPTDSIGIVQRFGKYIGSDEPGLRYKLPLGVDSVTLVPVRRHHNLEFGFSTPRATNPPPGT